MIVHGNAVDEIHKYFPGGFVHKAGHAEIHRADPVFFQDKDIARMGVGMEESVLEDLLHDEIGSPPGNELSVQPGGIYGVDVIGLDAVNVFHGQNPFPGFSGKDPGNMDGPVIFKLLGHPFHIGGLNRIIQLFFKGFCKFFHDPDRVENSGFLDIVLHDGGQVMDDFKINFNGLFDAGPLDFDGHGFIVLVPCPVNLADGGAGKRAFFHGPEHLVMGKAEFRGDNGFDLFKLKGGHMILEFCQFLEKIHRDQVRPGRQNLPHLDKGGAQLFQGHPDPLGIGQLFNLFMPGDKGNELKTGFNIPVNIHGMNDVFKAVF